MYVPPYLTLAGTEWSHVQYSGEGDVQIVLSDAIDVSALLHEPSTQYYT